MFDIFGTKDPRKALQKANEYIKEDKINSAIKVLEGNLTEDEESFDLYLTLARLYFEIEERGRTVEILRQLKSIVPERVDEIIALGSELYYRHASIDLADFLLQLYIEQHQYDENSKVLRQLSEREITLLITRYDKLKQNIDGKNVISKKDFEKLIILSTLRFFANESEKAIESIESVIEIETFAPHLLKWARIISRERYTDWHASLLLMRIQMVNHDFQGALTMAQRTADQFPESIDSLIALISSAKPPKDLENSFTQFLTELYIKKGDLDASIELLLSLLKKDIKKIDDVIKGLRELERINPENLKILYALGETYIKANRISLAIDEFTKILEVDPTQYDEVIKKYKEAFEKEPTNPQVIEALVTAYLKKNDVDAAVEVVEKAYEIDSGLLDEYIIHLNAILEKNIDNKKALYLLGLCYAHKGNHENARLIFENLMESGEFDYVFQATEKICEEQPDDAQYLNLKAKSLVALGREEEAFNLIEKYLEDHPEKLSDFLSTFDVLINKQPQLADRILPRYEKYREEDSFVADLAIARAYAFSGEYDKAVKIFERLFEDEENKSTAKKALIEVIQARPKAVPLLLAAARIFMKEGEVEIATRFFKTAQMVDPKAFFEIVDEFYDALKAFPKDKEVRVLLVETFFNRKLWDRVIEESKRAIEVFGRNSQYFNLMLGKALVEKGNLSDAVRPLMLSLDGEEDCSAEVIEYLDKILNIDKSNVPAHFARGRALSRAHRIDEAVEEYLLTVRILPARAEYVYDELKTLSSKAMANPLIIFAMGSVELVLKKYDDAIKHLLQACELDTSLVKRIIPQYERLIKSASSPLLEFSLAKAYHLANLKSSAVKYYMRAQAADRAYREPAISEMKKICAENPGDIESRKALAELYFQYNNLEDSLDLVNEIFRADSKERDWAKKFVSDVLKKNPKHIPSYYFLSHLFLSEKNDKKAIEVCRKLLEIAPVEITKVIEMLNKVSKGRVEILLYLGALYKDTGEINKAITLFEELFAIDTSFGNAIIYQIKEILKKDASIAEAYLLAHKIFVFQKEYERAIEAIKHAAELTVDNEEIILKEGQTYYAMGEPEKAIKLYTELLDRTKDKKAIYRLIKKTRQQYFEEKLSTIKGADDEERLERARIYLLMNQTAKAKKELQFTPKTKFAIKHHTIMKAKLYVKQNRPIDALAIMKNLPVDEETAPVYADIYEAMGSYEAAALVLRQAGVEDMEQRIASYERLAQDRRLAKGRYFIEGRS